MTRKATAAPTPAAMLRRRLYRLLEGGPGDGASHLVQRGLVVLILLNVVAVVLESVPALWAAHAALFRAFEVVSVGVFTLEYAARLWSAPEHGPHRGLSARAARLRFLRDPYAVIDLAAILPSLLGPLVGLDLRALRVFRLIRFFKLARHSPGLETLGRVLGSEVKALAACLVVMIGLVLTAASLMHVIEGRVQPEAFGTIPDAMWWAVVTLTTVGYGDVVPVTALGKAVSAGVMLSGLAMFALPIGIIATAFVREIHRRDFVVTWEMVARVPLFSALSATEIAEIMTLLEARRVPQGTVVTRRGEPAHSMYFIASGEVRLALDGEEVVLETGDFFGEIALLRRSRRSATAVAVTRVNLLVLSDDDFQSLITRKPVIGERVREIARSRVGRARLEPRGDIVAEELQAEALGLTEKTGG